MLFNYLLLLRSRLFDCLLKMAPVRKNKIYINSYKGKGYGDNPKYIAEEILRRSDSYDIVWAVKNLDEPLPKGIRPVLNYSKTARYELATSKIIICNVKHALSFKKKKNQYYIQTWHGSFGLKYIEKDAQDKLAPWYLRMTIADSANIDLLLSSSNWQTEEYKRAFWYNGEILEKGFPRNDIFFNLNEEKINRIKRDLKIPLDKKILLYGPTFRSNLTLDAYDIDLKSIKDLLETKTNSEWIILIRLHPNIPSSKGLFPDLDFVDVTYYQDGQEILAISDILITDYSSNMIDFILTNKPVFLYASDIQEYKQERGLKPVYFKLPFPICQDNKALYEAIDNFNMASYLERLNDFRTQYVSYDDGQSSKHVVDLIFDKTR